MKIDEDEQTAIAVAHDAMEEGAGEKMIRAILASEIPLDRKPVTLVAAECGLSRIDEIEWALLFAQRARARGAT